MKLSHLRKKQHTTFIYSVSSGFILRATVRMSRSHVRGRFND